MLINVDNWLNMVYLINNFIIQKIRMQIQRKTKIKYINLPTKMVK